MIPINFLVRPTIPIPLNIMNVFLRLKDPTKSVSRGHNLDFDTRIATGENEIPKIKADVFFRLEHGEFIAYADGKDKRFSLNRRASNANYQKTKMNFLIQIWKPILCGFMMRQSPSLINFIRMYGKAKCSANF